MKKISIVVVSLAATALLASGCATTTAAEAGATATESEAADHQFADLSWDQVSAAVQQGAVLVDARSASGYAKGTIPGAINVPARDEAAIAQLPEDKATQLIFFCGGPACSASTRCAERARGAGYTNVAEYKGGYPEWLQSQN